MDNLRSQRILRTPSPNSRTCGRHFVRSSGGIQPFLIPKSSQLLRAGGTMTEQSKELQCHGVLQHMSGAFLEHRAIENEDAAGG